MTKRIPKGTPKGRKGIRSNLPKDPKTGKVLPSPGRKKGIPNKITREAKEMIALAFEGLGTKNDKTGLQMLIETANKSDSMRMTFYTQLYAKLIPVSVQGTVDVNVEDSQALDALERLILGVRTARLESAATEAEAVVIDHDASEGVAPQLVLSSSTGTKTS